jgi:hypothetical protein
MPDRDVGALAGRGLCGRAPGASRGGEDECDHGDALELLHA